MIDQEFHLALAKQALVSLFHSGFPGAVVAGGYLRDVALRVSPKDMDIFIPKQSGSSEFVAAQLSIRLGVPMALQCDLSYGEDAEIARVFTQRGGLFQVIELRPGHDPAERAERHDFGLCLAHMGIDGIVTAPEAFYKDIRSWTCTLVHCESEHEHARSMRRWARWQAGNLGKLGFTLVDETPWKGMHQ